MATAPIFTTCSTCRHPNAPEARACASCAAPLGAPCPACAFANPPAARYCGDCAAPLPGMAPRTLPPSEAERRQLTVLFCDLVGSTDLSARLDPEDLREVLRTYHETAAAAIKDQDGYIAQYLGDGLLVYFGYPRAYDDSAVRGVRAALGIVRAIQAQNPRLQESKGHQLHVRIGIHTGPVVVSDVGGQQRQERLALGETPNLAARLQGLAEPDQIIISEATHRLVREMFLFQDLGAKPLKGIPQPVPVFAVTAESGARTRLRAQQAVTQTPLVGRDAELAALAHSFAAAIARQGPVVLLQGEPGIGKSRQLQALEERLGDTPHALLDAQCVAGAEATALHPIIDLIQRRLRIVDGTPLPERFARLRDLVADGGLSDALPLFAALLSLPPGDLYAPPPLTPAQLRQATFSALLGWLAALAARTPLVLVIEDLHWADPSTIELLQMLLGRAPLPGVLTLLTARPEFHPPWPAAPRLSRVLLERLPREAAAQIVDRVAGGRALPAELLDQILHKGDGVPLFIEEMTRAALESDRVRVSADRVEVLGAVRDVIPATVQDTLMARLDRLGAGRALAQLAAAIGRDFPFDLLRDIGLLDEESLRRELARLVDAGLVLQGGSGDGHYSFKHALIRDAAYQSLLRSTRQRYHAQILRVLIDRAPDIEQRQPELLAQHYLGAGLAGEAIEHWQRAGQNTAAKSAFLESAVHYRKTLEHLQTLPSSRERERREINLRSGLGLALISTQGFTAPEVDQTYARAAELCQTADDIPFAVLYGIFSVVVVRGDRVGVERVLGQVERIAANHANPALRMWAHSALASIYWYRHDFRATVEHSQRAVSLLEGEDPRRVLDVLLANGAESLLYGHLYGALAHAVRGDVEQARAWLRLALELAEQTEHPYTRAMALCFGGGIAAWLHDGEQALELSSQCLALAAQHGFFFWLAVAKAQHGWARALRGEAQAGQAEIREAIVMAKAMGCLVILPMDQLYLAEALLAGGAIDEGLAVVAEGRAANQAGLGGERELVDLLRIQGALLRQRGDRQAAEACLRQAIAAAEEQQAPLYQQRAAAELALLLQS